MAWRLLRHIVQCVLWFGLALSTLLLGTTVLMWLRSIGCDERWVLTRVVIRPDWVLADLPKQKFGVHEEWWLDLYDGSLWLRLRTDTPSPYEDWRVVHYSPYRCHGPEEAAAEFNVVFAPHNNPVWRYAGTGFIYSCDTARPPRNYFLAFAIPFWMLTVLFGLWPALFVTRRLRKRHIRRHRHAAGLCPDCGYDLRATPDRCPECGHVTAKG